MKELTSMVMLGLVFAGGMVMGGRLLDPPLVQQQPTLNLKQVQALAELVTLKSEIVELQGCDLRGYLGSRQVLIVVRGEILIGTDLSLAKMEPPSGPGKPAIVILQPPRLISASLDHARTKIIASDAGGLWRIVPGDAGRTAAAGRAYAEAQKALSKAGSDKDLIEQAKRRAEAVIREFCAGLGVKVEIRWRG